MKNYLVKFTSSGTIAIKANSQEEALSMFNEFYFYDAGRELVMNGYTVTEIKEESN